MNENSLIDEAYQKYERAVEKWDPVRQICEVMEKAYDKATKERERLGVDVTRTYQEYNRLVQEERKNRNISI